MYQAITTASQFRDAFRAAGRADQFSYEALGLLFDYLEEADSNYELDVIAICCDYSESTPLAILADYGIELNEEEKEDSIPSAMLYLEHRTSVVGITDAGTIVYAQF